MAKHSAVLYDEPVVPRAELALAALIVLFYFLVRYTVIERLDDLAWWPSYAFEAVFVGAVGFYYRRKFRIEFRPDALWFKHAAVALACGAAIGGGLRASGVPMPFPMDDGRTVFLLLNLSPLIEEGIFRVALWIPMALILARRNSAVLLAVNAAVFSAVHLYALTYAPEQYIPFIIVQALYVIGLAAACGWWMLRTSSVLYPILIHYLFNLGFYLASAH